MPHSPKNPLIDNRGRGTASNGTSRFDKNRSELDLNDYGWIDEADRVLLKTEFFKDSSRTIISENDSPDIPFRYSMNFYRGCEHGCAYCYARPTHEYLGLSSGLDFESKIFVKEQAPELLREKLMSPRWKPECITMSGVTDCYQPAEKKYELTRQCLKIFAEFKHPVALITKNQLVSRDIDVLSELAKNDLVMVVITITTLDPDLARALEPRTSTPQARIKTVAALSQAQIPVAVNVAPIIPGLTDHEVPQILKLSAEAGARSAGFTLLRLPYSVNDIFSEWLSTHRPESKEKVLNYVRDIRGGKLNDPQFGSRMRGQGERAETIRNMFHLFANRYGLTDKNFDLRTDLFCRPGDQLGLF